MKRRLRKEPSHPVHPFQQLTGIYSRSYSLRTQRFITDFGAEHSFEESVKKLGKRLHMVMQCRFTEKTKAHGVGDGALWMMEQGEKIAGPNFSYLIDLFHLCKYFSIAFDGLRLEPEKQMFELKD